MGRHGHQASRGQVAGRLEAAHDRPEPAELAFERSIGLEDTAGGKRQDLAAAVAEHRVGTQAQPGQYLVKPIVRSETTLTAVAVDQSFSSPPGTGPKRCSLGGTISPKSRAIRSAVSNIARTSGKWKQRSASMPGY